MGLELELLNTAFLIFNFLLNHIKCKLNVNFCEEGLGFEHAMKHFL